MSMCTICHNELTNSATLSCNHSFCTCCIKKWEKSTCPLCRADTNHFYTSQPSSITCLHTYFNISQSSIIPPSNYTSTHSFFTQSSNNTHSFFTPQSTIILFN